MQDSPLKLSEDPLEHRLLAFLQALHRGERPDLADHLPAGPGRHAVLLELAHADLEFRVKADGAARVEEYLARYPELAGDRAGVLGLIATEYRLRQRREPDLAPAAFLERFPQYREELWQTLSAPRAAALRGSDRHPSPVPRPEGPAPGNGADTPLTDCRGEARAEPAPTAPFAQELAALAPAQAPRELGRLGPYRILRILGGGGMGVVYLAEDPHLGREVALKVMRPHLALSAEARARFLREARATASLRHDHVVTVHQAGESVGVPFLVMELLQGESLEQRLQREGRLPLAEALRVGLEITRGLAAAHKRGLIHRDVKPSNVWLEAETGRVKLLDFGLVQQAFEGGKLTHSGEVLGTPAYMAPEQACGAAVDARTDLFSLGCVLYHLLAGRMPFEAANALATLRAVTDTEPTPLRTLNPEVPRALADLVRRLMAHKPQHRPASAEEVVRALETVAVDCRRAPPRRSAVKWWLPAAAVAGLALALGLALTGVFSRGSVRSGAVTLEVEPPGAEVLIDGGRLRLTAPADGAPLRLELAPGEYELQVSREGFAAVTRRVVLPRGGESVRVRLEPLPAPPKVPKPLPPPDRAAAEWVARIGGTVQVEDETGKVSDIGQAAGLPASAFRVRAIVVAECKEMTDAGVDRFRNLSSLTHLDLSNTLVTDEGVKRVTDLKTLEKLWLRGCRVTGDVVRHLQRLPRLTDLLFDGAPIADAGLAHLNTLKRLERLTVERARVTDAGLEHLQALKELRFLNLNRNPIKGAGLKYVSSLSNLNEVHLSYTLLAEENLMHLKNLPRLTHVGLGGVRVTDRGLAHLEGMTGLTYLGLPGTGASDACLGRLSGLKELKFLYLSGNRELTGKALRHLSGLEKLYELDLSETAVTDDGLAHLRPLASLRRLDLSGTGVTDAGLEHLRALNGLEWLDLRKTGVTAAGLRPLRMALPACQILAEAR